MGEGGGGPKSEKSNDAKRKIPKPLEKLSRARSKKLDLPRSHTFQNVDYPARTLPAYKLPTRTQKVDNPARTLPARTSFLPGRKMLTTRRGLRQLVRVRILQMR
jgi:hypothetical protein